MLFVAALLVYSGLALGSLHTFKSAAAADTDIISVTPADLYSVTYQCPDSCAAIVEVTSVCHLDDDMSKCSVFCTQEYVTSVANCSNCALADRDHRIQLVTYTSAMRVGCNGTEARTHISGYGTETKTNSGVGVGAGSWRAAGIASLALGLGLVGLVL